MSLSESGFTGGNPEVTIRRRWLRGKHWVFLFICMAMSVVLVTLWSNHEPSVWLVLGTLFVLSWDYNVTTMFVNMTTITADAREVRITHGPLPSLFGRNQRVERERIQQLSATKFGAQFAVKVHLVDGTSSFLVAPLVAAEQALFVEQQLEKTLGLVDFAVEGEIGAPLAIAGEAVPGAKSGAAVALLVPIFVIATIGLFFMMASTELAGALKANGPIGSWTFTPDDCSSGQRVGFGGVVLQSEADSSRVVRVVSDPVKGTLVVVAPRAGKNVVFDAEQCPVFDVRVDRSNTQINDIWAMQGTVTLDCPGLTGSVSFAGCH